MQFANWEAIIEGYCNFREKNWVFAIGKLLNNVLHIFDNTDTLTLHCESIGDKVWYIEVEYKLVEGFVIIRIPYKSLYLVICKSDANELHWARICSQNEYLNVSLSKVSN